VAGALQDHQRATVVGQRTFGKGSVQAIIPLPGGAGMRLTVSRYYTPSGHAIQADGVHPDVAVELEGKKDSAISYSEKDLEGHLAGQTSPEQQRKPRDVVVVQGDAGAPTQEPSGSEATNVPDDPATGSDPVLKVGWQTLQKQMQTASKSP
jgi:carboxyl-terminal processing protease